MPFGCKGGPATFQGAINDVLVDLQEFAVAFIDDIDVYSQGRWGDHLDKVKLVLTRLQEHGITLKASKCCFGGSTVQYLGHEVGCGCIAPISDKVDAIALIPPPKNKREHRRFLGVTGFYRRFVPWFADIAWPLTDLLKGGGTGKAPIAWSNECQHALDNLKQVLMTKPILHAPDFHRAFELYTDASGVGISAVLAQTFEDTPMPVAFYSRKLKGAEVGYSTIEKELLAILAGLELYKVYVGEGPIVVHSDHALLTWLSKVRTNNQRLLRWSLTLSEYQLTVKHIKGSGNHLADWLSRDFGYRSQ